MPIALITRSEDHKSFVFVSDGLPSGPRVDHKFYSQIVFTDSPERRRKGLPIFS